MAIRLDKALLMKAKKYVVAQSKTKQPIRLKTVSGNGVNPGIDLDDSATLLDIMEG